MSKLKEPVFVTEKKPFPVRLRKLMEVTSTTQTMLSSAVGVTRQTISLYCNGQNTPDIDTFVSIADYFNVSTAYLLGRSDVASTNIDTQIAGKMTGLSDHAISKLYNWSELVTEIDSDGIAVERVRENSPPNELNELISHHRFHEMIYLIRSLSYIELMKENKEVNIKNRFIGFNKVKLLVKELGNTLTYRFIINQAIEVYKSIIVDINRVNLTTEETRNATQADMDDF